MDIRMKNKIKTPHDLAPRGVRSTIKGDYSFNETFNHIFFETKKLLNEEER
jgi:hypothetical protein